MVNSPRLLEDTEVSASELSPRNIWLITSGEPIEEIDGAARPLRTGLLAQAFVEAGHRVTWWTARYDHFSKTHRTGPSAREQKNGARVCLLNSCGYEGNHSPWRVIDHSMLGANLYLKSRSAESPNVIVASFPPIELAAAAVAYGRRRGIPVVVDVRDLWPDVLTVAMSGVKGALGRVASLAYRPLARWTLTNATALTSITESMLAWGLRSARRDLSSVDSVFPFGYSSVDPSPDAITAATAFWAANGITGSRPTYCFSGSVNDHIDIELLIATQQSLRASQPDARLVVCGTGSRLQDLKQSALGSDVVVYPGWIGRVEIWTLLRMCRAGLVPYRKRFDFELSVPNKILEYLSAGLPIISTLQGPTDQLLAHHRCGCTIPYGDTGAMLQSMARFADDDTFREHRTNALRAFQQSFSANIVYRDMVNHVLTLAHVPSLAPDVR
jgi:glycosyltransferase involved in cell wall biosynthesis